MQTNNCKSAVVLVVDRLSASVLGPYGCTWVETPNFNAVAADSLLMETMLADAPGLAGAYRAYWRGLHACSATEPTGESLPGRLAAADVASTLLTDESDVAGLSMAEDFAEQANLPAPAASPCADAVEETACAGFFAAAIDSLTQLKPPFLLWAHARGLAGPWDAPLELRRSLAHEDDPDPPAGSDVPSLRLEADYDPDFLLGLTQSYAGQVMLLDTCLGVLLDAVRHRTDKEDLLLLVTSPRGFPLGEHLRLGDCDEALYGELLHVPCLMRRGDSVGALVRDGALASTADIYATLLEWFGLPVDRPPQVASSLLPLAEPTAAAWQRDRILSVGGGERSLRTPAWFLRQENTEESDSGHGATAAELFRKPDDRFEANEISDRCPAIVDQAIAAADAWQRCLEQSDFSQLTPLPEELVEGIE